MSRPLSPLTFAVTWGGSGTLPKAPGTWGSLAALPFAAAIHLWGGGAALAVATFLVTGLGLWAVGRYLADREDDDPQEVVIDEVAGQWLTLAPLAFNPMAYLVGFVAFRLFDTLKPWPIPLFERLPGALGVMADDLAAGAAAAIASFAVLTATGQM